MIKKLISSVALSIALISSAAHAAVPIKAIIIKTSLKKVGSHSDAMGDILYDKAVKAGFEVEKVSLKDFPLPICDGHEGASFDNPNVKVLHDKIRQAQVIFVTFPIYNYSVSAGTKNMFELTSHPHKDILPGDVWKGKVVGLVGSCGTPKSLLAPLGFANSLMMDQNCLIIPHVTTSTADDFQDPKSKEEVLKRLDQIIEQAKQLA